MHPFTRGTRIIAISAVYRYPIIRPCASFRLLTEKRSTPPPPPTNISHSLLFVISYTAPVYYQENASYMCEHVCVLRWSAPEAAPLERCCQCGARSTPQRLRAVDFARSSWRQLDRSVSRLNECICVRSESRRCPPPLPPQPTSRGRSETHHSPTRSERTTKWSLVSDAEMFGVYRSYPISMYDSV